MIKPLPLSLSLPGIVSLAPLACYRPLMNHKESVLFNCGETIGSFFVYFQNPFQNSCYMLILGFVISFRGIVTAASSVFNSLEESQRDLPKMVCWAKVLLNDLFPLVSLIRKFRSLTGARFPWTWTWLQAKLCATSNHENSLLCKPPSVLNQGQPEASSWHSGEERL